MPLPAHAHWIMIFVPISTSWKYRKPAPHGSVNCSLALYRNSRLLRGKVGLINRPTGNQEFLISNLWQKAKKPLQKNESNSVSSESLVSKRLLLFLPVWTRLEVVPLVQRAGGVCPFSADSVSVNSQICQQIVLFCPLLQSRRSKLGLLLLAFFFY